MNNIKEVALRVAGDVFDEHPYDEGHFVFNNGNTWIDDHLFEFLTRCLAELSKQEPVAYWYRYIREDGAEYITHVRIESKNPEEVPVYLHPSPQTIEAAVLQEREACAKVCDQVAELAWSKGEVQFADQCAAAIRARSKQ